ncbi:M1 family peptidase [Echinicola strongylocentroti]|uniref:Aminopeptidase N n=1 Tax=Echinicola strongylocentroti TaxID=1795355 RepID=A0A2Z4IIW6_9BACT|nr:M1 family metallopeptidase [Echinicola strongylocentroti]AWW30486.1 M1 family peptidase [Echinicola strongylocentroti]
MKRELFGIKWWEKCVKCFLAGAVVSLLLAGDALAQDDWTWGGEMDPLQEQFEVVHYSLDLEILPKIKGINAVMEMTYRPLGTLDTLRLDLISNYEVVKVESNGRVQRFEHHDDILDIYPDSLSQQVKIYYRGRPPVAENPPWSGGFTWSEDSNGDHWVGLSCQREGGKIFMPCLDHPSSKASNGVDLYIKVPFPYFVAANGRLLNQATSSGYSYYQWATSYPISNYNVNFTMGRFHELTKAYTSTDGSKVPMEVYVLTEHKENAPGLLRVLENSVQTQEKYFGPYPFPKDKIAVVETPYLGMEHQTINAYGNNFQYTKVGDTAFDRLLHHELGHEWWGNKVSVGDWKDFWIHEGICSYGDLLYYEKNAGMEAYLERAAATKKQIENEAPLVKGDNINSAEAYHPDIYTKGAFVMHSLRFVMGDEVFFPMLKAFLQEDRFTYTHQVTTKDFVDFAEQYSGKDLEGFFDIYLYSTKLPKLKVKRKRKRRYDVRLSNVDFSLPVEIKTSDGIEVVELSSDAVRIKSDEKIVVDPNGWYLFDE